MRVDTHGLVVASKSLSYTVGPLICRVSSDQNTSSVPHSSSFLQVISQGSVSELLGGT